MNEFAEYCIKKLQEKQNYKIKIIVIGKTRGGMSAIAIADAKKLSTNYKMIK